MTTNRVSELAEYADTHNLSAELEQAYRDETTDSDPMVTTSLRLPESLLDWVRDQADAEGLRPTALLRRWIEERRDGTMGLAERVRRLEGIVLPGQRSCDRQLPAADLLIAARQPSGPLSGRLRPSARHRSPTEQDPRQVNARWRGEWRPAAVARLGAASRPH